MTDLQRNPRAKYAKQVFYRDFNDVDIFIEDTALESKKIYVNLLKRVLGDVSFTKIFPIGNKDQVYQRCLADQGDRERPAVYIVDGDHDDLLDGSAQDLRRLYRLKRYCVENYLFDEGAAVSYLDDEIPGESRESIERSLGFDAWCQSISRGLIGHLRAVIVAHRAGCANGLPRANVRLVEICSESDGSVDEDLVAVVVGACRQRVDGVHGAGAFEEGQDQIEGHFCGGDVDAMIRFVSGKAVLLPLLRRRMRKLFNVSKDEVLFRVRLAKYCDVSELEDIKSKLS